MLVIGIAGGVASGKSLVTSCFQHFGAFVVDADRAGHSVLEQPKVIQQIRSQFGPEVLTDGHVDRKQLGRLVFASGEQGSANLAELERITHPLIGQLIREQLDQLGHTSEYPAAILDAPVMFKVGWDQLCDHIVFVDAPLEVRQNRALTRGWDSGELTKREARQTPLAEKRAKSTHSLDNSLSKAETYRQAVQLWQQWGLNLPAEFKSPSTLFPIKNHTKSDTPLSDTPGEQHGRHTQTQPSRPTKTDL